MATEYQIKFYKKAFAELGTVSAEAALSFSTSHAGAICFDTTTRQIYVGGVAYGGAVSDANYANGVLTITKSNGTQQTLDFNDVASAGATLAVFDHMNSLIGTATESDTLTAEYANTNYLQSAGNLIAADKALDTAIYNLGTRIDNLNGSATIATVNDNVVTLKVGVTETGGIISNTTGTDITLAEVAVTGAAEDVSITSIQALGTSSNVQEALQTLSEQITAGDVSIDSSKGAFFTDDSIFTVSTEGGHTMGVKTTGYIGTTENGINLVADKVDTAGTSTEDSDLATVLTVKTYIGTEIAALDVDPLTLTTISANAITIANVNETDGKIGVSGSTSIPVDGTVDANNPLLTKDSLNTVVQGLDVTEYAQAVAGTDSFDVYGIYEADGKIHIGTNKVSLAIADGYNASTNKVATKKTVTDAVEALDVDTIQPVTVTQANENTGASLSFPGVKEVDGKIAVGTGEGSLQFAKVATSGIAADVAISDAGGIIVGTNVEDALQEIARKVNAAAGGMRFNGAIDSTTATVNTSTGDIRPGDIYLAHTAMTIGTTSVEAGDMIIYTGTASNEPVTLTADNCSIVERETDVMVTSATDLVSGQIVLGSGGKEVAISTITEANLLTAMANANSALQSIGNGTDGQYITTTITTKDANNTQNVSVALTTSTVTSDATTLSGTNGVLTNDAIAPIKSYVDAQIDALDVTEDTVGSNVEITYSETNGKVTITSTEHYATISSQLDVTNGPGLVVGSDVTTIKSYIDSKVGGGIGDLNTVGTVTGTNVTVKYEETNGIITIGTIEERYAGVSQSGDTTTTAPALTISTGAGLVTGNDLNTVKTYVDNKVGYEINRLDSIGTSDNAAVARVEVVETDGKISDVIVTNINAGVSYTAASGDNPANLTFSTATGAVTGNDITEIKNYVDAKAAVVDTLSTVAVNSGDQTKIASVGGQDIHTAVSFTWEEYS